MSVGLHSVYGNRNSYKVDSGTQVTSISRHVRPSLHNVAKGPTVPVGAVGSHVDNLGGALSDVLNVFY